MDSPKTRRVSVAHFGEDLNSSHMMDAGADPESAMKRELLSNIAAQRCCHSKMTRH